MTDAIVEQVAGRLSTITFLDLSYCGKIGAVGSHRKALQSTHAAAPEHASEKRRHHGFPRTRGLRHSCPMPKLKQIAYLLINTGSVLEIVFSCHELEFLGLRGCWNVKLDEKYSREKFPNLKILGPHIMDHYEASSWEGCSDYSDSFYDTDSFDGMWDEEESLELRFYEGFGEDSGRGWPPSP